MNYGATQNVAQAGAGSLHQYQGGAGVTAPPQPSANGLAHAIQDRVKNIAISVGVLGDLVWGPSPASDNPKSSPSGLVQTLSDVENTLSVIEAGLSRLRDAIGG